MAKVTYTTVYNGYWNTSLNEGIDRAGMSKAHETLAARCNALNMNIKNISIVNDSFVRYVKDGLLGGGGVAAAVALTLPIGFIASVETVVDIEDLSRSEFSALLAQHEIRMYRQALEDSMSKDYESNKDEWDRISTATVHKNTGMFGPPLRFEDAQGKEFIIPVRCISPELIPDHPTTLKAGQEAIKIAKKIKECCEPSSPFLTDPESPLDTLPPDIATRLFAIIEDPKDIDCRY